jgi:nucleotide-binding universal stress UspA family protein
VRGVRPDDIIRFAHRRRRARGGEMSIFPTKILLATDGSTEAELAARSAVDLSQKTDSELHLIHVMDVAKVGLSMAVLYSEATDPEGVKLPDPVLEEELERSAKQEGREALDEEEQRVRSAGGTVAHSHLRMGEVEGEIVHLAEDLGAGLIVMGSRGRRGMRRALMGSVSDSVVRHAHCPVMVVRAEPVVFPTKLLVATDRSREAQLGATTAADLAKSTNSELHVVHVGFEQLRDEAQKELDTEVGMIRESGAQDIQAHLNFGMPARSIVELAEELGAGLIVMGSRGLGGVRRALMGSISDSVVRHAHCPVLVVRQEEE